MLVIFIVGFLAIALTITQIFVLIPVHTIEFWHAPTWLLWGLGAIALSWLMGD